MDPGHEAGAPGTTGTPGDGEETHEGRLHRTVQRARVEQERITRKVEETHARLEEARPRSPVIDAVFRTYERDTSAGGVVLAGALAFRVFLFLVPYVFVLVVGFGAAGRLGDTDPTELARKAGIAGVAANAIGSTRDLSTFETFLALGVGLFAMFLASRSLLKVLRVINALVWHVPSGKFKSLSKASVVFIGIITGMLLVTALVDRLRDVSFIVGLVAIILYTAIPAAAWGVVTWYLPNRAERWEDVVPGAVLFGVGALFLHVITVYWIVHEVESKTDTYGAIGAAVAILLWAYLLGRLMAASAVLNVTLVDRRTEKSQPDSETRG